MAGNTYSPGQQVEKKEDPQLISPSEQFAA
jgi:hypothetical protein